MHIEDKSGLNICFEWKRIAQSAKLQSQMYKINKQTKEELVRSRNDGADSIGLIAEGEEGNLVILILGQRIGL